MKKRSYLTKFFLPFEALPTVSAYKKHSWLNFFCNYFSVIILTAAFYKQETIKQANVNACCQVQDYVFTSHSPHM